MELVKDGDSDDGERISHLISKHETSRLSMSIIRKHFVTDRDASIT